MTLQERIKYVSENYDTLPRANTDKDVEFVIIAEHDQKLYSGEDKECLAVNKKGELLWVYLSGCSCGGSSRLSEERDVTAKIFQLYGDEDKTIEEFYDAYKCEPHGADYKSY